MLAIMPLRELCCIKVVRVVVCFVLFRSQPTDKIVYIDGAFDLFHVGHIATLKHAKALGDFLYVGIHEDPVVNKHKGQNYPIMELHERVLNVLSCKYVDEVVIGAPWNVTEDLLTVLNVQVVASGSNMKYDASFNDESKEDPYAIPKSRDMFQTIQTAVEVSTSTVVQRIIDNRLKYEKRNAKRGKKENDYLSTRTYVQEL